jgi:hypothetical protein
MKPVLASVFALLLAFLAPSAHAASDADVTLIKVKKVVIEESVITIVVAEAKTRITKELQDGKEVGRIGYYAPDIVIKGNMIDSITGFGFLYSKGK